MPKKSKIATLPDETVITKILLVRDKKVMIDRDLADLYGVTTFRLNEQVKRNKKRFPEDFMFQLNKKKSIKTRSSKMEHQVGVERAKCLLYLRNRGSPCYLAY